MNETKKRNQQIDDFILFLEENNFNSSNVDSYIRQLRKHNFIKKISGLLLIIFALTLIVLPLPGYLEIATIFYFNPNDGITVSDLFAIFILLLGIILFLKEKTYFGSAIE
jgi:hypothetical protein